MISIARLRLLLFCVMPLLFGTFAVNAGMDGSWDLRNYHYYNGWALLHGEIHRDLLVSQIPSFYNPLLDLPYAWAAGWMDARALAFLLGALHGANFILLTLLGETVLQGRQRKFAMLLALVGCGGAVALSELGVVFYDNVTSIGLFATLLLLARRWDRLDFKWALLAGLPLGLAFGVKQVMAIYVAGTGAALFLALPAAWKTRFHTAFAFGLGVLAGTLATGGFWMAHLWAEYRNPMFPYFNQIFHSPWGLQSDYRDPSFEPKGWLRTLFYPLYFGFDSRVASEVAFRDFRVPLLFVLSPLALWLRRGGFLMLMAVIAYLFWLKMFGIYRYLLGLEMLAPLLITMILPARAGIFGMLAIQLFLVGTTLPASWIRMPFTPRAVEVSLPPIADPDHSLVLLAGHEPMSFLIPAFPEHLRFLRIDSTFTNPDQTEVPFNALMKAQIDAHQGPLLALFIMIERHDVVKRLGNDGLTLTDDCGPVRSPIGAGDYQLCRVERQ
jgi:hypothetical protein